MREKHAIRVRITLFGIVSQREVNYISIKK